MCSLVRRLIVLCFALPAVAAHSLYGQAAASPSPALIVDTVTNSKPLPEGIEVQAGPAIMRITALRDDIIRVRIAPDALPEDASWAVMPEARSKSVNVQPIDESTFVGFHTAALEVRVEKNPARIVIQDLSGNVILADSVGRPVTFRSGGFSVHKAMLGGEHFFGLGDKTGAFDRGGQA